MHMQGESVCQMLCRSGALWASESRAGAYSLVQVQYGAYGAKAASSRARRHKRAHLAHICRCAGCAGQEQIAAAQHEYLQRPQAALQYPLAARDAVVLEGVQQQSATGWHLLQPPGRAAAGRCRPGSSGLQQSGMGGSHFPAVLPSGHGDSEWETPADRWSLLRGDLAGRPEGGNPCFPSTDI